MSLSVFDLHALKGDTTVACSVFGPGEVRQARELIDRYILLMCRFPTLSIINTSGKYVYLKYSYIRSLVEVCFKPRLGMPGVKDRDREEVIDHQNYVIFCQLESTLMLISFKFQGDHQNVQCSSVDQPPPQNCSDNQHPRDAGLNIFFANLDCLSTSPN